MTAQLSEEIRKGWMAKIPLRRRLMLDDGPVGLVDLTLAKQIVEAAC